MDRPTVVCHVLQSIDGKIAGSFFGLPEVGPLAAVYGRLAENFEADAVAYGTTTLDEIFTHGARPELAAPESPIARVDRVQPGDASRFLVAIDPEGTLGWMSSHPEGRPALTGAHIIAVLCEGVDDAYLAHLQRLGISYIFAGVRELNLTLALGKLKQHFGIKRVLLQGGGLMDGSFASEDLIDELSIVVAPAIDCSSAVPTSFETGDFLKTPIMPVAFELKDVQRLDGNGVWLRYARP